MKKYKTKFKLVPNKVTHEKIKNEIQAVPNKVTHE